MGAAAVAPDVRDTVVGQLEVGAGLCAGRDFHTDRTIYGGDFYLSAQGRLYHTDVLLAEDEVAFSRELFVRFDADVDIEITLGTVGDGLAVLTQTDGGAVVNAGRNLELDGLALGLGAFAATDGADLFGNLAAALTFGADAGLLDITEDGTRHADDLAGALALVTGLEFIARFYGSAFAVLAGIFQLES